jgi:hypothetical protein
MAAGFSAEYKAAILLAESGYFENPVPMLERKAPDENVVYYRYLKQNFPELAADFLHDLSARGIDLHFRYL